MRKIVAVFLALTIITVFAACKGKEETPEYSVSLATTTTQQQQTTDVQQSQEDAQAAQMTYVLTTSPDKTVPWQNTTRFEIIPVTIPTTDETTTMAIDLTTGYIEIPVVSSDYVSTTIRQEPQNPTAPSDFTNNTTTTVVSGTAVSTTVTTTAKPTTTVKPTTTTQPSTTVAKVAKSLAIESSGYNSNTNCIILDVSSDGWSSDFKGTTKNVTVMVDGQALQAPCRIPSSKNADGRYEVSIDLSDLGISSGSTVSYTIGESVIQTKAGTQYNSAYSGTCDIG